GTLPLFLPGNPENCPPPKCSLTPHPPGKLAAPAGPALGRAPRIPPSSSSSYLGETRMTNQVSIRFTKLVFVALLVAAGAHAKDDGPKGRKWVASWITAPQGTFGGVNAPRLVNLAFPFTSTMPPQASNQTLRMIVKPDVWGDTMRVRLSNYWGTGPVTFTHVTIGLQSFSGATVAGTNTTLTFKGHPSVMVKDKMRVFSDPVKLPWVHGDDGRGDDDGVSSAVDGRNLAISIYIAGQSGPMTFHSTALQESFLAPPNTGDR